MRFGVFIRVAFAMLVVCCGLAPASLGKDGDDRRASTIVSLVSPSSEVCAVTVPNPEPTSAAPPDYLTAEYDFSGADQGISVDDPIRGVTWIFPGDSKSADADAWFGVYKPGAGGANVIGYLNGKDYGNPASLCDHFRLVTVPGMTSTTGGVYSPDVMVAPPHDSIDNYIFTKTPNLTGAKDPILPPNSGIPGIDETNTGVFFVPNSIPRDDSGKRDGDADWNAPGGKMYLFYAGSPGLQVQSDGSIGLPLPSVSYLADWKHPSPIGTTPDVSPTTYDILARVDFSTENDTTTCAPMICPPGRPNNTWPSKPPLGGHFVWVDPVVSGDMGDGNPYVYLFGTGKFRASHVYLARIREKDLDSVSRCGAAACYLAQTRGFQIWTSSTPNGTPHWSPEDSAPSADDIVNAAYLSFPDDPSAEYGQISVRYYKNVGAGGLWLMMSAPTGGYNSPPFTSPYDQRVIARWALSPLGPWSDALTAFDMRNSVTQGSSNEGLYCCQGKWTGKTDANGDKVWECLGAPDGNSVQQCMECKGNNTTATGTPGPMRFGFYAPDKFPDLTDVITSTKVQSGTRSVTSKFTVSYLLSIFEPYNSVLFKFTLQTVSSSPVWERE